MPRFISTGNTDTNDFINTDIIKRVRGAFAEYDKNDTPTGFYSVRCYYNDKFVIDESDPDLVNFEDFLFEDEHLAHCFIERITKCDFEDLHTN